MALRGGAATGPLGISAWHPAAGPRPPHGLPPTRAAARLEPILLVVLRERRRRLRRRGGRRGELRARAGELGEGPVFGRLGRGRGGAGVASSSRRLRGVLEGVDVEGDDLWAGFLSRRRLCHPRGKTRRRRDHPSESPRGTPRRGRDPPPTAPPPLAVLPRPRARGRPSKYPPAAGPRRVLGISTWHPAAGPRPAPIAACSAAATSRDFSRENFFGASPRSNLIPARRRACDSAVTGGSCGCALPSARRANVRPSAGRRAGLADGLRLFFGLLAFGDLGCSVSWAILNDMRRLSSGVLTVVFDSSLGVVVAAAGAIGCGVASVLRLAVRGFLWQSLRSRASVGAPLVFEQEAGVPWTTCAGGMACLCRFKRSFIREKRVENFSQIRRLGLTGVFKGFFSMQQSTLPRVSSAKHRDFRAQLGERQTEDL